MLTARQVREQLSITRPTLEKLIKTGEIAAIQVGARGDYRISEEDLADYIARSKVEPQPAVTP